MLSLSPPQMCFINELDHPVHNSWRVIRETRQNPRFPASLVQLPIGVEDVLRGVTDRKSQLPMPNDGEKLNNDVKFDETPVHFLDVSHKTCNLFNNLRILTNSRITS